MASRLRYRVEIGPALRLALEVENRGPAPLAFEEALHTYLAVDDVERISVTGLEGAAFLDETAGFARKREGPDRGRSPISLTTSGPGFSAWNPVTLASAPSAWPPAPVTGSP